MPSKRPVTEHPILRSIVEKYSDVRDAVSAAFAADESAKHIGLSPRAYYASVVFDTFSPILDTVERLRWSIAFLTSTPDLRSHRRLGVTKPRWMEYHYSYFVLSYAGVRDLALLFTNQVFRLGLPSRHCNPDTVLRNDWVVDSPVPKAVARINALAQPLQEVRNRHLHRGVMPDLNKVLGDDTINMLTFVELMESQAPEEISDVERRIARFKHKEAKKKSKKALTAMVDQLEDAFSDLFDAVQPVYERKHGELGATDAVILQLPVSEAAALDAVRLASSKLGTR